HPEAEYVVFWDVDPDVSDRHLDQPPQRAIEQGDHLDRRRLARAQLGQNVVERDARVDDVLNQQDMTSGDGIVEVTRDTHSLAWLCSRVTLQVEVVDHE